MKYGVSSNTLLLTAGIVWLVAGINILRIGISCWITDAHYWLLKVCEASLIFLLFFCIVFHKLYRKHAQRRHTSPSSICAGLYDNTIPVLFSIHSNHCNTVAEEELTCIHSSATVFADLTSCPHASGRTITHIHSKRNSHLLFI